MEEREREERLREAATIGDMEAVRTLLSAGARLNSQNPMNGWTCLHWACKRNHRHLVSYLLSEGADKDILTKNGERAEQLTSKAEIRRMLGGENETFGDTNQEPMLPFVPNYLANPPIPNGQIDGNPKTSSQPEMCMAPVVSSVPCGTPGTCMPAMPQTLFQQQNRPHLGPTFQPLFFTGAFPINMQELVLKVRIQDLTVQDADFIEVELDRRQLTYGALLGVCCRELDVEPEQVQRIRKLPNTHLRKDKEVARLQDFQELELVLHKMDTNTNSAPRALTERPCYNYKAAGLTY
ncbi:ankyrin repeat domain-containing protein 40 [Callorhinchus milii]|uniref:Ankyrin repeat domain 40 n=1 Tax=Callorhinchus milii TaxID=7868 RepID=V9KLU2_CALMI|nr:ankyrin repeat domain-containing protein 40 [Callorhinchus milii]|eukprot:gi/632981067/ref/XP_007907386.1/ PREDICTED: ankyrin repeat domain-containing protein 40 [Callorhinchus milii]